MHYAASQLSYDVLATKPHPNRATLHPRQSCCTCTATEDTPHPKWATPYLMWATPHPKWTKQHPKWATPHLKWATLHPIELRASQVSYAASQESYVASQVSYVTSYVSYAASQVSYAASQVSYAASQMSYAASQVSYAASQVSYAALITSIRGQYWQCLTHSRPNMKYFVMKNLCTCLYCMYCTYNVDKMLGKHSEDVSCEQWSQQRAKPDSKAWKFSLWPYRYSMVKYGKKYKGPQIRFIGAQMLFMDKHDFSS